ncbi:hypothetical protein AWC31_14015 [Mycolicibacterium wolinskyi]|uniref:Uncharacterized protein n=1 Tax=Mycolicibacterium wolinskyi TaxID=59750 RepID=A0A1X2FIZ3_9MYCO|nr:hypothetical protein AWC31_14015 [Mycolicibacterium wolinskyi]
MAVLSLALAVAVTVLVVRPDDANGPAKADAPSPNPGYASANDTGPANIVTEDPTCEAWTKVAHSLEVAVPEWNKQDYSVPATEWSPAQRAVFEKQSVSLKEAIPKVANLAQRTPRRVMWELYGQFNAYAQAVIDSIPTYSANDNEIVAASNQFTGALTRVCDAIYYRAAQQTSPVVALASPPTGAQAPGAGSSPVPEQFLHSDDGTCADWIAMVEQFNAEAKGWRSIDSRIPATEWTTDQKAVMDAVAPIMTSYANNMERLGRGSGNPVWEDFAVFAAQYMRAYVQAIPTYTPNVSFMASQSTLLASAIHWACKSR